MRKKFCSMGILDYLVVLLFPIIPTIFLVVSYLNKYDITATLFLISLFTLLFVLSLCKTEFIYCTEQNLIVKNIFGKTLRQYNWNELKEVKSCFLQSVQYSYNCYVFCFSDKSIDSYNLIEEYTSKTSALLFLHKDFYVKKRIKTIILELSNIRTLNNIDGIENFIV